MYKPFMDLAWTVERTFFLNEDWYSMDDVINSGYEKNDPTSMPILLIVRML